MIKQWNFLTLFLLVGQFFFSNAWAGIYQFERNFTNRPMLSYSSSWNTDTEELSISSTWDNTRNVDRIDFLLSDGGSPWLDTNEQFLFYSLDLVNNVVNIYTYFNRQFIESHNNIMTINADSFSLTLDHSDLNDLTFAPRSFNGAGFFEDIGIWYYLYENGRRIDTYDVHHAQTTFINTPDLSTGTVPVPGTVVLMALVLFGFNYRQLVRSVKPNFLNPISS